MTKKSKNVILPVLLTVGLIGGVVSYKKIHSSNSQPKFVLSYSKTDITKTKKELSFLKIRTYTDLNWGENGRNRYFGNWKPLSKYNFYPDLPQKCLTRFGVLVTKGKNVNFNNCSIISGEWKNSYKNETLLTISDLDIDHIVPLKDAWNSGANKWSQSEREKYANTPSILLITTKTINENEKKNKSPEKWMPKINKCTYIFKWIDIKYTYNLSTTNSEYNFIESFLKTCK